jgi:hypothetical protein
MDSGQDANPDPPDAEVADPESELLERSRDAIDEGREAAREALKEDPPDPDEETDADIQTAE